MLLVGVAVLPPQPTALGLSALGTASAAAALRGAAFRPIAESSPRGRVTLSTPPGALIAEDVRELANGVLETQDNAHLTFVVIDKRQAHLYVIGADGRLVGHTPVLLGAASGDDSVPGIGERPIGAIQPFERTTPAGRFEAAAGRNAHGDDIVWVDYDAAISMHRVRATNPHEQRLERLASPTAADNRITYGCINVPVAFFDEFVGPLFGSGTHAVYILPEVKTARQVFGLRSDKHAGR